MDQERLEHFFEVSLGLLCTADATTNTFVDLNPAWERTLGWTLDELRSRPFTEFVHPDDLQPTFAIITEMIESRRDAVNFENRYLHKDGTWVWLSWNGVVRDGRFYAAAQPVGGYKEALQLGSASLRETQGQLRSVVRSLPMILWSITAGGMITLSEGQGLEVLGLTAGQLVGTSVFEVYADWPEALGFIRRGLAGESFAVETTVGGRIWTNRYFPTFDDGGAVSALMGISLDVTENKRMEAAGRRLEEQIRHAQKLESLGVLAGGIAHDFNNLLVGVLGNVGLAQRDLAPESPVQRRLKDIEVAAVRAAELTNQMLAYSGKGKFVVEVLDLNRLIEEMGHLLGAAISKRAVIKYRFSTMPVLIEADATQIRQVVMNLMTNASDALGDKDGVITISTGEMEADDAYLADTVLDESLPAGSYVFFEVSDTGCGMDAATRQRIFDPFFSTKFTGRGLGLAAVLGIVRGHGGALKLYSEPNRGTTFKILFARSSRPAATSPRAVHHAGAPAGGRTVLVVDDEPLIRTTAEQILTSAGFLVLTACDGLEALELFREHRMRIAAVLLDMTMPRMGGEETFRALRSVDAGVRVVLMSGYNEQDATSHFAGKGLAGFLQKPFTLNGLVRTMTTAVSDD